MVRRGICLISLSFIIFFSFNVACAQQINPSIKSVSKEVLDPEQIWQEGIGGLRATIQKLIEENKTYRLKFQKLESQVKQLQDLLASAEQERLQALNKPIELEEKVKQLQARLSELESESSALRNQIEVLAKEKESLAKSNSSFESKKNILKDDIKELKAKLSEVQSEHKSLQKQIKILTKQKESLSGKNSKFENKISVLENKIKDLKKGRQVSVKGCTDELDRLKKIENLLRGSEKENFDLKQELSGLRMEKSQLTTDIKSEDEKRVALLEAKIISLQANNEELKAEIAQVNKDANDLLKNPNQLQSQIAELKTEIASLRGSLDVAQDRISSLAREKVILESMLALKPKQPVLTPGVTSKVNEIEILAYDYAQQGKYKESVKKYKEALKLNPDNKDIYYNLGSVYSRLGDYKNASKQFEKVLDLDPSDKQTHYNLSKIYEYIGDEAKAKSHYSTYLNLK